MRTRSSLALVIVQCLRAFWVITSFARQPTKLAHVPLSVNGLGEVGKASLYRQTRALMQHKKGAFAPTMEASCREVSKVQDCSDDEQGLSEAGYYVYHSEYVNSAALSATWCAASNTLTSVFVGSYEYNKEYVYLATLSATTGTPSSTFTGGSVGSYVYHDKYVNWRLQ